MYLVVSSKFNPEYAGSGLRIQRLYQRLAQREPNLRWQVICSSVAENRSIRYEVDSTPVFRVACKPFQGLLSANHLIRRLQAEINFWAEALPTWLILLRMKRSISLVHVVGNNAVTGASIIFARLFGIPLVVELVNQQATPEPCQSLLFRWLFRTYFPSSSVVICISRSLQMQCSRFPLGAPVWCRPNPVDEARFYPSANGSPEDRESVFRFKTDDVVLLNIAKFYPLKNQIFLLEVLSILPPEYKLVCAGPRVKSGPEAARDASYYEELTDRIQELGLEHRVELLLGFVTDVPRLLRAADIFVFPTTKEAFGTPILEALACGLPVVATEIPGVTDMYIRSGVNGALCVLIPELFAEGIRSVRNFTWDSRLQFADAIFRQAGTAVIDDAYRKLFERMLQGSSPAFALEGLATCPLSREDKD